MDISLSGREDMGLNRVTVLNYDPSLQAAATCRVQLELDQDATREIRRNCRSHRQTRISNGSSHAVFGHEKACVKVATFDSYGGIDLRVESCWERPFLF